MRNGAGTEEGITPAVRCCARGTLFDNFGRKQFIDVAEGRLSLDDFMAQLSDDDLLHLLGGQPNVGVSNTSVLEIFRITAFHPL